MGVTKQTARKGKGKNEPRILLANKAMINEARDYTKEE
jgi:hypothetical protein